jgi:uncharacterized protein YkwD
LNTRRFSLGSTLVLLCFTGTCGHVTRASSGPVVATSRTDIPAYELGAGAERYTTAIEPGERRDPLAVRLSAEIAKLRKKLGKPAVVSDARLDRFALDVARLASDAKIPPSSELSFLLAHQGLVDPEPNLCLIQGDDGAEDQALEDFRRQLVDMPASASWQRGGIGILRRQGGWTAVLAFQAHRLELLPMPRWLPSGGQSPLSGRLLGNHRLPQVLVTAPAGTVRRLVTTASRDLFSTHFACSLGDGVYQVEVAATDAGGPAVLANFPVYCGVPLPTRLASKQSPIARVTDPAQAETQMLELLNRDRAANGLPALVLDPRLAKIAREHSREMSESGEVAHISRRSGSVVDRARKAGLAPPPRVLAENVGCDRDVVDGEHGFMSSPGHRDNILSRLVTHVGIGVAIGRDGSGGGQLFFTQVFVGWGQ